MVKRLTLLLLVLLLTAAVRCWTWGSVFAGEAVLFADPDCYSRMTRVERVYHDPGEGVIRHHEFENWPHGTVSHTTMAMDWATATLARGLAPFSERPVDLAGAWVSVVLGVFTALFLWFWWGARPYRLAGALLFAVSPLLVHGTVLGRPDHQSLLLLLVAMGLGALAQMVPRGEKHHWVGYFMLAWSAAIWVSLYEPVLLCGAALLLVLALNPRRLLSFESLSFVTGVFGMAYVLWLMEGTLGTFSSLFDPVVQQYFPAWSRTIGELAHVPPLSTVWLGWTLGWLPLSGVLLWRAGRQEREAWYWLGLLALLFGLTCWQVRWGYFFSLVFVMSLPMQMRELAAWFPRRGRLAAWVAAWVAFAFALWPVAAEWDHRFTPEETARRREVRSDQLALRDVALQLKGERSLPVLAPWWFSPALAYWSGQPCVAGSSHQSLPGIVDAARFWLMPDFAAAEPLLKARQVAAIVAYEPQRVVPQAIALLGEEVAEPERVLGATLFMRPSSPPAGLEFVYGNAAFRVYLYPPGVK